MNDPFVAKSISTEDVTLVQMPTQPPPADQQAVKTDPTNAHCVLFSISKEEDLLSFFDAMVPQDDRTPEMLATWPDFLAKTRALFKSDQSFVRGFDFTSLIAPFNAHDHERVRRMATWVFNHPGCVTHSSLSAVVHEIGEAYTAIRALLAAIRNSAGCNIIPGGDTVYNEPEESQKTDKNNFSGDQS